MTPTDRSRIVRLLADALRVGVLYAETAADRKSLVNHAKGAFYELRIDSGTKTPAEFTALCEGIVDEAIAIAADAARKGAA